ncbi:MAG: sugar phosphate nucleotidyltransferase [Deltaproteobacteria bacterium]|nr:sugar phosphate nucleotidyltransferase [Deltaproteobacteria bacterium]
MSLNNDSNHIKVLLLCGGKGERLSPLTSRIPKPLVPINGTPILNYLVTYFEKHGLRKFIIAAGYKSDKIYEYFKNNHKNLEIQIIDSGDVDILTRIQAVSEFIPGDFIMCYGDTLADVDLNKMIDYHHSHDGILTVTSYPLQSSFGILDIGETGKVMSFMEKPVLDKWINIGYFYFSKECVRHINDSLSFVDFLNERIARGEMYSFKHRGLHITVNTITELRDAENNIASFNSVLNR